MLSNKEIIETGKYALNVEIKALQSIVNNSVNEKFCELVNLILGMSGRVFFSGIGKPGYIAHKSAATFASTGTPSFYIHPSEASHGDLGMIEKNDIVVLLSNSGGSAELNDIIAYCKRNDIKLVSITRRAESFVSASSDLAIVLENIEQTNPVNSPTSDIVMFLGYLDAVATALIKARGFNNENFKMFHPGGKLGSALIKVNEIMRTENIPLVYNNSYMSLAIDEMISKNLGCVGIIDKNTKKLIGIITDGDLKRKIKENSNLLERRVDDIMTVNPKFIFRDALAVEAASLMSNKERYVQVLFVIDKESNVVGILHIQDLFKAKVI